MNISILTTEIRSEHDVMLMRQRVRQIASLLGFEMQDQTRIATAVSEIARNAVQHAGGGKVEFHLAEGTPQSVQILVRDNGPGIADIESMLAPPSLLPVPPGDTLRGVCRLMDTFHIETAPAKGTLVTLGKRRSRSLPEIQRKDMARITGELTQRISEDPLAEMQRQNQELLHTLEESRAQQEELRVQQEERIEHLKEIEALNARLKRSVQATHHRVKNNLQIIVALVEVQTAAGESTVPASAILRVGQHARSLAALHDLLTQEPEGDAETEVISTKATLGKLIPLLQATAGGRSILYQIDDFLLSVGESASLALLISELISNALKHGTNDINLILSTQGEKVTLEVSNDGCGFPLDFDWRKAANTGLSLIDSTGRHDLNGTISYENRPEGGARVTVVFPLPAQREPYFRKQQQ